VFRIIFFGELGCCKKLDCRAKMRAGGELTIIYYFSVFGNFRENIPRRGKIEICVINKLFLVLGRNFNLTTSTLFIFFNLSSLN
jgi:hypothetical protein